MVKVNEKKSKLEYLRWWDILVITIIMFGPAIINSTNVFFHTESQLLSKETDFSSNENLFAIATQSIQLGIAGAYLLYRKFDFSIWKFKITLKNTGAAILLFIFLCVCMDVFNIAQTGVASIPEYLTSTTPIIGALSEVNVLVVLFSLLNGVYEEIYFLGICTAVNRKYLKIVFIFSLIIRISFHTYQGLMEALGIGLILGIIYFLLYKRKSNNLYIYMFSHT